MTYNAYTSNGAWVIPSATIGTTRFQMTSSSFVWLYGASNVAPTTTAMSLTANGLTVNSNIFSGGVRLELGSNGNSSNDIQMTFRHHDNPAVINERQFINANATMNEISVSAGAFNGGGVWTPYNPAGTALVAFMSVRKDRINFYTAYLSASTADSSLTPTVSITYDGTGVNGSTRGNMTVSGNITANRYEANGGNMTARTGGVYNRGNDNYSSCYQSINWIPGNYAFGVNWNIYDTVDQGAAGIVCGAQVNNAIIEFWLINNPSGSNPPIRKGYFNNDGFFATSKNFSIEHPTVSSCTLVHASIEGPRYDLIYRNRKQLVDGSAEVDIEKESTANGSAMTPGTFDALATNADVFLQNNDTFDRVKGYVSSHMLFIQCENSNSSAFINWMVVAERHDKHLINSGITDASGFLILEHYVSTISSLSMSRPNLDEVSTLST